MHFILHQTPIEGTAFVSLVFIVFTTIWSIWLKDW